MFEVLSWLEGLVLQPISKCRMLFFSFLAASRDAFQWFQEVPGWLERVFEGVVGFSCVQWPSVLFLWQFSVLQSKFFHYFSLFAINEVRTKRLAVQELAFSL